MSLQFVIAFADAPVSDSPNARATTDQDARTNYYQAITVAFASLRRFHDSAHLSLAIDHEPPNQLVEYLASLNVEYRIIGFNHRPPEGFSPRFVASLFFLDALAAFKQDNATVAFLDPDLLCVAPLATLFEIVSEDRVGLLPIPYPATKNINGLTRIQAAEISAAIDESESVIVPHYGGEFVLVGKNAYSTFLDNTEKAFQSSIKLASEQKRRFLTEEHMLSFAARYVDSLDVSDQVRRIWTTHSSRDVQREDMNRSLWHLPAEKGRGFRTAFHAAQDPNSWFWKSSAEDFVKKAAEVMAVRRSPKRLVEDAAAQLIVKARKKAKR